MKYRGVDIREDHYGTQITLEAEMRRAFDGTEFMILPSDVESATVIEELTVRATDWESAYEDIRDQIDALRDLGYR